MKVLLINKFLFPKGGDAISTLETGKLLIENGHDVIFWGMDHPENIDFKYRKYFISYIDYNGPQRFFKKIKNALKIIYSFEAKNKISSLIKEWKPDIVHLNNFAHQITPSILGILKKLKIPTVMTLHDYKLVCPTYLLFQDGLPCERCKNKRYHHCLLNKCTKNSFSKSLINMLEMYLHHKILNIYDKIDLFISPSKFLIEKLKDMGFNKNIIFLPNFVELIDLKLSNNFKYKYILFFGRLSKEKGLSTLIDAVKDLKIILNIVGIGPVESELKNKIEVENISNINLLGFKKGKELTELIKESLYVIVPSEWYENNPLTILESYACGKPVIGSRMGGIPELIIDKKTGLIFNPGDKNDLKEKIKKLLDNPEKIEIMGSDARKFVEDNYNSKNYYNKIIDIYKKIIINNNEK